jgi:hypothetical protein
MDTPKSRSPGLSQPTPPKKNNAWTIISIILIVILTILVIVFLLLWILKPTYAGIGQACPTSTFCAAGLVCNNSTGLCECLKPIPPTNLQVSQGLLQGSTMTTPVTITWNAAPLTDWYDLILSGPEDQQVYQLKSPTFFFDATSGDYNVSIFAVSANCGFDEMAPRKTSFTVV